MTPAMTSTLVRTNANTNTNTAPAGFAAPPGVASIAGVVCVAEVRAAVRWYERLGFEIEHKAPGPNGDWDHAQLRFGNSRLFVQNSRGVARANQSLGLYLYVRDVDNVYGAICALGGRDVSFVTEQPWGDRCFQFNDPFGVAWTFATHVRDVTEQELVDSIADGH